VTHQSKKRFSRAFTLLELALAIAIFVIAACGILSLFISSATIAESAGNVTRAINVAREELENNVKQANFATLTNYSLLPPNIPNEMSLACYVQNHPTLNDIRQVTIVVSHRGKSQHVIGEDENLNGLLDGGEDTNGDGRLSSLCEISTFIARQE